MSIKLYQSIRDLLKYFGFQRNYKMINHFFPRVSDNHYQTLSGKNGLSSYDA